MNRLSIMAHMIPFFPDLERSYRVARALADGGARYLEIQFPYSDPTADGPAIQGAGARALAQGFTVRAGWEFVAALQAGGRSPGNAPAPPIFVMSYAGLVYAYGVDRFVARAAELGVEGVIVPDLPLDSDEGLIDAGARHGVNIVPVIALGAAPHRMALVHGANTQYVYASLRRGITGAHTEIGAENIAFLEELGARGAKVLAGFGIDSPGQVEAVTAHAHAAVVGSAFVRAVNELLVEAVGPVGATAPAGRSTAPVGATAPAGISTGSTAATAPAGTSTPDPYHAVRALTEYLVTPR